MATVEHDVVFTKVTRNEVHAELDKLAHETLGISGDEFMRRWQNGEVDRFDETVSRLAVLTRLL